MTTKVTELMHREHAAWLANALLENPMTVDHEVRERSSQLYAFAAGATPSRDAIEVVWRNYVPGKGRVTIICYGCAWTSYFNAMSGLSIQEFFARCDVGYLVNKLGTEPSLKVGKLHDDYLGRIIKAVQAATFQEGK
jgi:hypothetical protein